VDMPDMLITTLFINKAHRFDGAPVNILHSPRDAHCNARQMFVQNVSSV